MECLQNELCQRIDNTLSPSMSKEQTELAMLYFEAFGFTFCGTDGVDDLTLRRLITRFLSMCVPWEITKPANHLSKSLTYRALLRWAWRYTVFRRPLSAQDSLSTQPLLKKKATAETIPALCFRLRDTIFDLFRVQDPTIDQQHPEQMFCVLATVLYVAWRNALPDYAKVIQPRIVSLLQWRRTCKERLPAEALSEVLFSALKNEEDYTQSRRLHDNAWVLLALYRPPFTALDDLVRTVDCFLSAPDTQRSHELLAYLLMESGRFTDELAHNPDALLYLLQSFAALVPEDSAIAEELDIFRPRTRAEVFPLDVDMSDVTTPQTLFTAFDARRKAPYTSARSALGGLHDCLRQLLNRNETLSTEHLLQILHLCAIPSPISKKKPKFIRSLLRRLRPHLHTFAPDQLIGFVESVLRAVERSTDGKPSTLPTLGWRAILQRRRSNAISMEPVEPFKEFLDFAATQLRDRLLQELHVHSRQSSSSFGSAMSTLSKHSQDENHNAFFDSPFSAVRIAHLLHALNITTQEIAAFMAQRLLAGNACWIKQDLCQNDDALQTLFKYFELIKETLTQEEPKTAKQSFKRTVASVLSQGTQNADFCSISSVPLRIVLVSDILNEMLSDAAHKRA